MKMIVKYMIMPAFAIALMAAMLTACNRSPENLSTEAPGINEPQSSDDSLDAVGDPSLPPISGEPVKLTLLTMYENRYITLAKQKFEEEYPNIELEIRPILTNEPPVQAHGEMTAYVHKPTLNELETFMTTLNAELMAGKPADIIVTSSHFPYQRYADKKLLASLQDWMAMDPAFVREHYYTNMLDALAYGDSIYALPANAILDMLAGDQAVLGGLGIADSEWSWDSLREVALEVRQGNYAAYGLGGLDAQALLNLLVRSEYDALIDTKNRTFDEGMFREILTYVQAMQEDDLLQESADSGGRTHELFRYFQTAGYIDMVYMTQMVFGEDGALFHLPSLTDNGGKTFTSDMLLSIGEGSEHKREAWAFIAYLMSEEMQSVDELSGLPVNRAAGIAHREKLDEVMEKFGSDSPIKLQTDGKSFAPQPPKQADIDRIERVLESVSDHVESDPRVTAMIERETAPFLAGKKSLEDTMDAVLTKVGTYLLE